jgi:cobalt-zinc-cadmium efflux system outer membrane protein
MKRYYLILGFYLLVSTALVAQDLDYNTYINYVMQGNLEYSAAKLDLAVSQADLVAARKITDPTLSAEYGNNSDWDIAMGQSLSFGLEKSISLGKRAARIRVARHGLDATDAGLRHFAQTLRADATLAFLDALLARDRALIGEQAAEYMQSLYHSDSLRHTAGEISETDLIQTRIEANIAHQDLLALLSDYRNALLQLDLIMGQPLQTTRGVVGQLAAPRQMLSLKQLLAAADTLRMDLLQQRHLAASAQDEVTLIRRERTPDIDLSLGVSLNSRVRNEEAPAPQFVGYTVGVGIPLPVSNLNRGEVLSAQLSAQQEETQTEIVRRQVQAEIIQAYNLYTTTLSRLDSYGTTVMASALQMLEGKRYAYHRGETSLLDLINAQHTYNQIQQDYTECLHDCMAAYIELLRSAGLDKDVNIANE